MEILSIAHARGVRRFRVTGGEPTLREELGQILLALQDLSEDVRIAITTNGYRLDRLVDVFPRLNEPKVFISVDGLHGSRIDQPGQLVTPKVLHPKLDRIIQEIVTSAEVRFNFVLTRISLPGFWDVLDAAIARKLDFKIFELLHRDYYWAGERGPAAAEARYLEQFVSIRELLDELRDRFGPDRPFRGTGGRGMPMRAFVSGSSRIIYYDSLAGSHYGDICRECPISRCGEGLYAALLDASGFLHPAGCVNRDVYYDLTDLDRETVHRRFAAIESVIEMADFVPEPPKALRTYATT